MRWLRKVCRFSLAFFLWLHALFVVNPGPAIAPYAARLKSSAAELIILLALAVLTLLANYGIGNVVVDAIYIYCFPFIFLFYCALFAFKAIRRGYKAVWGEDEPLNVLLQQLNVTPTPTTQAQAPKQAVVPETPTNKSQKASEGKRSALGMVLLPFRQFVLLWCLLLLLAAHQLLVWIALIVVLFQLARFLIQLLAFAVITNSWLGELEQRIRDYADELINKALMAREATQDLPNLWAALTALQVGVALLRDRRRVVQWTMYLGTLLFLALYLYLAVIFSFAYYGIARVQNIPYDWGTSFIDSMFMPLTFGSLPRSNWIKILGGVHAFSLVALGVGTIFGYIRRKLDSLHDTADELGRRLQQADLRARLAEISLMVQPKPQPAQSDSVAQPGQ